MTLFGAEDQKIAALAQVAVERSVDRYPDGLTYALPPHLAGVRAGERVQVPLGKAGALVTGTVISVTAVGEGDGAQIRVPGKPPLALSKIKHVAAQLTGAPGLPSQVMELAQWVSAYYACPVGMTLGSVLPAAVKRGVGTVSRSVIEFAPAWQEKLKEQKRVTAQQRAVIAALESALPAELPMELRDLCARAKVGSPVPVKRLVHNGVLALERRTQVEAAWRHETILSSPKPVLTAEQDKIVNAVGAVLSAGFSQHLLYGVTGSGKTEVYMRLIEQVLHAGKSALYMVPEIALTPQTAGRLLGRFPRERVAILHSGLTAAQRNQQWSLVAAGQVRVVMGTRSAVFAPIPDGALGLIVVDEEHDGSYKQDQQPRYHGRDVAIKRAQIAACPVLMGSATPSLESWFNATGGGGGAGAQAGAGASVASHAVARTSMLHRLPHRAPGLTLPRVQVVDFVEERRQFADQRIHLLGPTLAGAIKQTLADDGQVLILLNRRGYANYIACASQVCGWMMRCDHCDAGMICHRATDHAPTSAPARAPGHPPARAAEFVRCHHCGTEQRLPKSCPDCGKSVSVFGFGVQRVEEQLQRLDSSLVPGKTMLRLDADSMHTSSDFHHALGEFAHGRARMLVGTQMIAKGLDFPGVRLVGVVNADTALNLPDFRASERTFQLVSQVSGRCGRGADAGRAIVQTFQPQAPAVALAAAHDYEGFAKLELEQRKRFGLPPWRRMVRFVVRDENEDAARLGAEELARGLSALPEGEGVEIRGPYPCPIARIADRWRIQIEAFADGPAPLQRLLAAARNSGVLKPGERIATDVDPTTLM